MVSEIALIGGPFDGASGPYPHAGHTPLWVEPDPLCRSRNGLLISLEPHSTSVRYDLASHEDSPMMYVFGAILPTSVDLQQAAA
jgi:hypothetical protein